MHSCSAMLLRWAAEALRELHAAHLQLQLPSTHEVSRSRLQAWGPMKQHGCLANASAPQMLPGVCRSGPAT